MSVLSSSAEVARASTERMMSLWSCPRCTFANPASASKCEICELAKPSDETIAEGALSWNCSVCTFENKPSSTLCEMCGTRKDEETPDPRSSLSESRRGLKLSIATKKLVEETPIIHLWKLHGIRWKLIGEAVVTSEDGSKSSMDDVGTRHMGCVVGTDERVYIYGGTSTRGDRDGSSGFVVLQRDVNIWGQPAAPADGVAPLGRICACAHQLEQGILVFGGFTTHRGGSAGMNDLWMYEPVTNTWTQLDQRDTRGRIASTHVASAGGEEGSSTTPSATPSATTSSSSSGGAEGDMPPPAPTTIPTPYVPRSDRPCPRGCAASCVYAEGKKTRLLVFGGCSTFTAGGGSFKANKITAGGAHNDLYQYDFDTDLWAKLEPVGHDAIPAYAYATGDVDEGSKCFFVMGVEFDEYKRLSTPASDVAAGMWMYSIKSNHWWEVPLPPDMEVRIGGSLVAHGGYVFYFETLRTGIFWVRSISRAKWYKMSLSGSPSGVAQGEPYFASLGAVGGTMMFYVTTDMVHMSLYELSLDDIVATLSREFRPTDNLRQDLECLIDHELFCDVQFRPKAWCGLRTISAHRNMLCARGLEPEVVRAICEESTLSVQDYTELMRYIYLGTVKIHSKQAAGRLAQVAASLGLVKLGKYCDAVARSDGDGVPSGYEEIDPPATLALHDMGMPLADIAFVTRPHPPREEAAAAAAADQRHVLGGGAGEEAISVFRYDVRKPPVEEHSVGGKGKERRGGSHHHEEEEEEEEMALSKGVKRMFEQVGEDAHVMDDGHDVMADIDGDGDGGPSHGHGSDALPPSKRSLHHHRHGGREYLTKATHGTARDMQSNDTSVMDAMEKEVEGEEEEAIASTMLLRPVGGGGGSKDKGKERAESWEHAAMADGRRTLRAHKNVLLARSSFFQVMLQSGMREATEERIHTHFSHPVMCAILEYLYTGDAPRLGGADIQSVLELFEAAHMYELIPLVKLCVEQLKRFMDDSCVTELYTLGVVIDVPELAHAALQHIRKHYHAMEGAIAELPPECRAQVERDHTQGRPWMESRCCVEHVMDNMEECIDRVPQALGSLKRADFRSMSADMFVEAILRLCGVLHNEALHVPAILCAAAGALGDHINYATVQMAMHPDALSSDEDKAMFRTKFNPQISEFAGMALAGLSSALGAAVEGAHGSGAAARAAVRAIVTLMDVCEKPLHEELVMANIPGTLRRLASMRSRDTSEDARALLTSIDACLRRIAGTSS